MKYYETFDETIKNLKDKEIFLAKSIYKEAYSLKYTEAAFFKKLERMTKEGLVSSIARGVYYKGNIAPNRDDVIEYFTANDAGMVIGYALYNKLGISDFNSCSTTVLSSLIEKKSMHVGNIEVKKVDLEFNDIVSIHVSALEILKDFENIEGIKLEALVSFLDKFALAYNENIFDNIVNNNPYSKNTIDFVRDVLDYKHISNGLGKYLSELSSYKHAKAETIFESTISNPFDQKIYVMSGDVHVASFKENDFELTIIDDSKCPLYLKRTKNVNEWIRMRAIDGSRHNARSLKRIMGLSSYADDDITALKMDAANITDNYWIKKSSDSRCYDDIRIKTNKLFYMALDKDPSASTIVPSRNPELTNIGSQEKAWKFENEFWWLYKNESQIEKTSEMITYEIGKIQGLDMAEYQFSNDKKYIKTKDITEGKYNLQHADAFVFDHKDGDKDITDEDYIYNYEIFSKMGEKISEGYLQMIYMDALCSNVDRHTKNYGVLTDRNTGEIVKFAPNYDNNESLGTFSSILPPYNTRIGINEFISLIKGKDIHFNIPELKEDDVKSIVKKNNVWNCYVESELVDYIMWRYNYIKNAL